MIGKTFSLPEETVGDFRNTTTSIVHILQYLVLSQFQYLLSNSSALSRSLHKIKLRAGSSPVHLQTGSSLDKLGPTKSLKRTCITVNCVQSNFHNMIKTPETGVYTYTFFKHSYTLYWESTSHSTGYESPYELPITEDTCALANCMSVDYRPEHILYSIDPYFSQPATLYTKSVLYPPIHLTSAQLNAKDGLLVNKWLMMCLVYILHRLMLTSVK